MTGRPKGEATVTYDDPESANAAISWFSGELIRSLETLSFMNIHTKLHPRPTMNNNL